MSQQVIQAWPISYPKMGWDAIFMDELRRLKLLEAYCNPAAVSDMTFHHFLSPRALDLP